MRVLYLYPWGSFYPAACGADVVACNHLAYFQSRHCEVRCLILNVPGREPRNFGRLAAKFPCIESIQVLEVAARTSTVRDLLFGFERAARSATFRGLAEDRFDLFFSNSVLSAPFAWRCRQICSR